VPTVPDGGAPEVIARTEVFTVIAGETPLMEPEETEMV
jgi:hypothetical protein